jgi:HD-GYP domain-containing protein (c-di-GMP phosphodiesterase class II)
MTTDRPYRKGRSVLEAVKVLEANVNTQFDPRAVEALKAVLTFTS